MLLFANLLKAAPNSFTFQSKIFKPDGLALEAVAVNFRFTTLDPSGTCILYVEDFLNQNMTSTGGLVVFNLGNGSKAYPAGPVTFTSIFDNLQASFPCQGGGTFTPLVAHTDGRKVVLQFSDGSPLGWQTLPAVDITSVPYANFATNAEKLAGFLATDYVRTTTLPTCGAGSVLTYNGTAISCVAGGTGTVTGIGTSAAAGNPITIAGTAAVPTVNIQAASTTLNGYLLATDFMTFNNKQNALGFAPLNPANNLSELTASSATARTNLGLGTASTLNVAAAGNAAATEVVKGNDTRLTGAIVSGATAGGDLTGTYPNPTLVNVVVTGTNTKITYDAKGRVTAGASLAAIDIPVLDTTKITTGTLATARLGSGTADATTFLRGDNTWNTVPLPSNVLGTYQVRAATTANIALTGTQTIDGVVLIAGDRVLVKNQTTLSENGVYVVAAGAWTRSTDLDSWTKAINYTAIANEGTSGAGMAFLTSAMPGGTIGTTSLNWKSQGSTNSDVALGLSAGISRTASSNGVFIGTRAGSYVTGLNNTLVGSATGQYATTAADNVFVGTNAGTSTTTGTKNVYLGNSAAYSNTAGTRNVYIGDNVGNQRSTGYSNIYIGANTGSAWTGSNNTMIGDNSGGYGVGFGGGQNTFLGFESGYSTSGNSNVLLGYQAGRSLTTGSSNVIIGGNNAATFPTVSNNISISDGIGTERIRVLANGNMGIGEPAPTAVLQLKAGTAAAGTSPLKFAAGPVMTTPENGSMEFDGTNYYVTSGGTRRSIASSASPGVYDNVTSINNTAGNITLAPAVASGSVNVTSTTVSTNASSGALVVSGGVGIAGALNVTSNIMSSANITAGTAMYSPLIYGGTAASQNITIDSTTNATKGYVLLAPSSTSNVGIGTTTPGFKLEVDGNAVLGPQFGGSRSYFDSNGIGINTSTSANAQLAQYYSAPTSMGSHSLGYGQFVIATGGASTGNYYGSKYDLQWSASANSPTATVTGYRPYLFNTFTAYTLGSMTGVDSLVSQESVNATASVSNLYGLKSIVQNTAAAATVGSAYGIYSKVLAATPANTTNSYGVYIDSVQGANKWSVYAVDATAPSYFAGNVGIGTTTPAGILDVNGGTAAAGGGTNIKLVSQTGAAGTNNGGSILVFPGAAGTTGGSDGRIYLGGDARGAAVNALVQIKGTAASGWPLVVMPFNNSGYTQVWASQNGAYQASVDSSGTASFPYLVSPTIVGTGAASGNITIDSTANATKGNIFLAPTGGNVGIGTTTPGAALDVKGHIANSGISATLGACGTSPAITGNDTKGFITVGTGVTTSCVITFNSAFTTLPVCTVTWRGSASTIGVGVSASATALTVNFSADAQGLSFNYHCLQ